MASSGNASTSAYSGRYLIFEWWINSQSKEKNQTIIGWSLKGAGGSTSVNYSARSIKVIVDGSTIYSLTGSIGLGNGTVVSSGTHTLTHDVSGNKSFTVKIEGAINYSAVNVSGQTTFSLDKIDRKSVLGTINKFPIGTAITIPITKYSSSFTDTLVISVAGTTIKTVSPISNGSTVTFSSSELNKIYGLLPSSTSATFTFALSTKSGSTTIGTHSRTAIGSINTSVIKPSLSYTISEAGVVPTSWGVYVKNKSKLKFVISATAGTGASIKSISSKIDGITYSGSEFETQVIKTAGNITASVAVTDTRNITSNSGRVITIVDYSEPKVTKATAIRCDVNGDANDKGTYIRASLTASVSSVDGHNTASFKFMYKKTTDTTWTEVALSSSGSTYNNYVIIPNIDINNSYNAKFIIKDYFTEVTKIVGDVPTAFVTIDYLDGGKGVAIGKVAEREGLDIGMDMYDKYGNEVVSNSYSLEERVIGTWIDGKPIYRKTKQVTINNSETSVGAPTNNLDLLINVYGFVKFNSNKDGYVRMSNLTRTHYKNITSQISMYYNGNGNSLWIERGSDYTEVLTAYVTFEYTKTTD